MYKPQEEFTISPEAAAVALSLVFVAAVGPGVNKKMEGITDHYRVAAKTCIDGTAGTTTVEASCKNASQILEHSKSMRGYLDPSPNSLEKIATEGQLKAASEK